MASKAKKSAKKTNSKAKSMQSKSKPAKKMAAKKPTKLAKKPLVKKAVKKPAKQVAKQVARKAQAKASVKSAVKPGVTKVAVTKPVAPAPVAVAKPVAVQPQAPRPVMGAPVMARPSMKPTIKIAPQIMPPRKGDFTVGEYVVYPTHGVGCIMGIETETIGTHELKVFVIGFEKDKMTLRVPVGRAQAAGLRGISPNDQISKAIATLKGRAKIARGMWSRRAQEYEAKINSGNLVAIAEVVRDLHKNVDQSERSYSERMIYETALHRLSGEVAASERVELKDAQEKLLKVLRKQAAQAA